MNNKNNGVLEKVKLKLWDKQECLRTPNGEVFTPEEYIKEHAPWVDECTIVVINEGDINCKVFYDLNHIKEIYEKKRLYFKDLFPQEIVDKINLFNELENDTDVSVYFSEEDYALEISINNTREDRSVEIESTVIHKFKFNCKNDLVCFVDAHLLDAYNKYINDKRVF